MGFFNNLFKNVGALGTGIGNVITSGVVSAGNFITNSAQNIKNAYQGNNKVSFGTTNTQQFTSTLPGKIYSGAVGGTALALGTAYGVSTILNPLGTATIGKLGTAGLTEAGLVGLGGISLSPGVSAGFQKIVSTPSALKVATATLINTNLGGAVATEEYGTAPLENLLGRKLTTNEKILLASIGGIATFATAKLAYDYLMKADSSTTNTSSNNITPTNANPQPNVTINNILPSNASTPSGSMPIVAVKKKTVKKKAKKKKKVVKKKKSKYKKKRKHK